ncbi:NAD(P)/FAD-dependent oxidoreductase [Thermococcus stetteri]|uniref:NAD(P)/FAD-dependent oxidoreductase n=1 Tax=Thermococcus stetteri TaxID=49900 RepID=UPI001AE3E2AA|nr:FAD-dependent oxidoreductase [Thermococcus stetteri]MBP1912090.1 sulfide:quinone oxidoreductase [Thermococcus stetteri]
MAKVLILGGGTAGLVAGRYITAEARRLGLDVDVTMVTASERHYMPPLFMEVALGSAAPHETWAPIKNAEKIYGFKVDIDRVVEIDLDNRQVKTDGGKVYDYDYLFLGLGVKYVWDKYKGMNEYGYHNYTLEGAMELHERLSQFKGGKIVIYAPESPHTCGIYPYEMSLNLRMYFEHRGIEDVDITIVHPSKEPGMGLGPDLVRFFKREMEKARVKFIHNEGHVEITPNKVITKNAEVDYDLLIKIPPIAIPDVMSFMADDKDPRWAKVKGPDFRYPGYDEVYVVSEASMPPLGLLTAGVPLHNATVVAATSILHQIHGGYPVAEYAPTMCVGHGYNTGFSGNCEYRWNGSKYERTCYLLFKSPLVRLMKDSFYRGWLDSLRL